MQDHKMTLKTYIDFVGNEIAAKLFNVKIRTIVSWKRGDRSPRLEKAKEIIKATKGKVTMEGIYSGAIKK